MAVLSHSTLTCPECGHAENLELPTDTCLFLHECAGCSTLLRAAKDDCCVFCSYGDVACPSIQEQNECCAETVDEAPVKRLDLIGFFCPIPVHETRKAMAEMSAGEVIEVIGDDPETLRDMPALCDRIGAQLLNVTEDAGEYTFRIRK
jgi:TusA-related sulfurtransferase